MPVGDAPCLPTTEHNEQTAVINWADSNIYRFPELEWLYAIINGIPLNGSPAQKGRVINYMKAEGMKPGISDLCLPSARGGYFGLYLEMKRGDGKVRDGQNEFLEFVSQQGYYDAVCYSADEAIALLEWYLEQDRTKPKVKPKAVYEIEKG